MIFNTGAMLHLATGSYWLGFWALWFMPPLFTNWGLVFRKDTGTVWPRGDCCPTHGSSAYRPVAVLSLIPLSKNSGLNRRSTLAQMMFRTLSTVWRAGDCRLRDVGCDCVLAGYDAKAVLVTGGQNRSGDAALCHASLNLLSGWLQRLSPPNMHVNVWLRPNLAGRSS